MPLQNLTSSLKERFSSLNNKISAVFVFLLFILWFAYFCVASQKLADPLNAQNLRVWVTKPKTRVFPQFSACPHPPDSKAVITSLTCSWYHDNTKTRRLLKPTPLTPTSDSSWICMGYNVDGSDSDINFVECNGTTTLNAPLHFYFDDPKTGADFFKEDTNGDSDWINPYGSINNIAVELTTWGTSDESGGKIEKPSLTNPSRTYKFRAHTLSEPKRNFTVVSIWWGSDFVWHYENYDNYGFALWLGLIGGAAFTLSLIHSILMFIVSFFFPPESRAGYTEMK